MRHSPLYGSLDIQQAFILKVSGHLVLRSNHVYDVQLGKTSFSFPRNEILGL